MKSGAYQILLPDIEVVHNLPRSIPIASGIGDRVDFVEILFPVKRVATDDSEANTHGPELKVQRASIQE